MPSERRNHRVILLLGIAGEGYQRNRYLIALVMMTLR